MNAKTLSPLFFLTVLLGLFGAALPFISLVRGGGLAGSLNDAGLLVVIWGASPYVLFPLSSWMARRPWVRVMSVVLVAVAVLFSLVAYGVIQPRLSAAEAPKLYFMLPVWQWPMGILSALLALFVPSVEQEREMAGEPEKVEG